MTEEKKGQLVTYESKDGQTITLSPDIVRKYLVHGRREAVSDMEIFYFMGICKARGLNKFKKDCYLIKYAEEPAAIVTSIDFFRARARNRPDCRGWRKGILVQTKDGKIKESSGLLLEGEQLVGGFFEATPAGWTVPFRLEVNLRTYMKKTKEGKPTRFWSENPEGMIAKVAESQGLRTLWPDEFQGMFVEEELAAPPAIDITPGPPARTFVPIETSLAVHQGDENEQQKIPVEAPEPPKKRGRPPTPKPPAPPAPDATKPAEAETDWAKVEADLRNRFDRVAATFLLDERRRFCEERGVPWEQELASLSRLERPVQSLASWYNQMQAAKTEEGEDDEPEDET